MYPSSEPCQQRVHFPCVQVRRSSRHPVKRRRKEKRRGVIHVDTGQEKRRGGMGPDGWTKKSVRPPKCRAAAQSRQDTRHHRERPRLSARRARQEVSGGRGRRRLELSTHPNKTGQGGRRLRGRLGRGVWTPACARLRRCKQASLRQCRTHTPG
jgi:hypothetical protein